MSHEISPLIEGTDYIRKKFKVGQKCNLETTWMIKENLRAAGM